jgi:hypothetical protein
LGEGKNEGEKKDFGEVTKTLRIEPPTRLFVNLFSRINEGEDMTEA